MKPDSRKILELTHNGDPYGSGFYAIEYKQPDSRYGVYRGDIGARPRIWWRMYARRYNFILREAA